MKKYVIIVFGKALEVSYKNMYWKIGRIPFKVFEETLPWP